MKRSSKIILSVAALGFAAVALSSCTASFCSIQDRSRVAYTYDVYHKTLTETDPSGKLVTRTVDNVYVYGTTTFWDINDTDKPATAEALKFHINGTEYTSTKVFISNKVEDNLFIKDINSAAAGSSNYILVNDYTEFWKRLDSKSLDETLAKWNSLGTDQWIYAAQKPYEQLDKEDFRHILLGITKDDKAYQGYGYVKYLGENDTLWNNWDKYYSAIRLELGADFVPSVDYNNLFKTQLQTKMNSTQSCIATKDGFYGYYGYNNDNKTEVFISAKDWNYAWHLNSFPLLEGVFVYPISWLIDTITNGIMGVGSGLAQMLAILIVTFIIRGIMLLATFKSTTNQARMQEVQPELAKIQAKYPNANSNNAERSALAQETNELYKKNNIHPFSSLLVLFVQFPVFICVWGAMQGSAVLSSGSFLGLYLSDSVSSVLFNVSNWPNVPGWWTALVMFLIMAALQVVSMLLPQILQKRKAKKAVASTGRNANVAKQNNTMKWFTIIMMVMVIIMGFSLASGMVIYWIAGSLFSIAQTLLTEFYNNKKANKKKGPKKPVKATTSEGVVLDAQVEDIPDAIKAPTGKKKFKDRGNK